MRARGRKFESKRKKVPPGGSPTQVSHCISHLLRASETHQMRHGNPHPDVSKENIFHRQRGLILLHVEKIRKRVNEKRAFKEKKNSTSGKK